MGTQCSCVNLENNISDKQEANMELYEKLLAFNRAELHDFIEDHKMENIMINEQSNSEIVEIIMKHLSNK